jgi:hypothetical protein
MELSAVRRGILRLHRTVPYIIIDNEMCARMHRTNMTNLDLDRTNMTNNMHT